MKVLAIGPSVTLSHGGIATVIGGIVAHYATGDEGIQVVPYASCLAKDRPLPIKAGHALFAWLRLVLCYRGYDIYHIHMASFGSAFRKQRYIRSLKRMGKRVVVHIHGGFFLRYYGGLPPKKQKRLADALKQADGVIALSEGWRAALERELGLTNVVAIPNCVDPADFPPGGGEDPGGPPRLLYLSRMKAKKGAWDLIEALALLEAQGVDFSATLAGDGEVDKARALVAEKGLAARVAVLGWTGGQEKQRLLRAADVVVLPSHEEGLPMVLLEGMAAGKAVVSTPVGAIPELVEAGVNGLLVTPGAVEELAGALGALCRDALMRRRMGRANREKTEALYSPDVVYKQLTAMYRQIGTP